MNGHGALLQTESLQRLALRGGRGRHLLAPDGKVLNLILAEGGKRGAFGFDFELYNKESNLTYFFFNNLYILVSLPVMTPARSRLIGRP